MTALRVVLTALAYIIAVPLYLLASVLWWGFLPAVLLARFILTHIANQHSRG